MTKLFIPVLAGTTRPGRQSIKASQLILEVLKENEEVESILIDPAELNLPGDGNDPENKDARYTELTAKADAFFVTVPEYNNSFPGSLKRLLDSELKNYFHKPIAFAGVSAGIFGGVKAIESLVPVVRELGLVASSVDVHFMKIQNLYDEDGNLTDPKQKQRVQKAVQELIWLAKILKKGREDS